MKYATTAFVATPNAASIARVELIRSGSVTHAFDQNSRAMSLAFTRTATGLNVTMPPNGNTAPPGYYMLYIVDASGVPSVASFVRFPAPYETAPGAPTSPRAVAGPARRGPHLAGTSEQWRRRYQRLHRHPLYRADAQPPIAFASAATTETVTGLTSGTTYTFTISAKNAIGTGPPSVASNAVKPS